MLALAQANINSQLVNEEDLSDWGSDFDDDYCDGDGDGGGCDERESDQCPTVESHTHARNTSLNISHSSGTSSGHIHSEVQYLISSNGSLSSGCSTSTTSSRRSDTKDESRSHNGSIGSFGSSGNGTASGSGSGSVSITYTGSPEHHRPDEEEDGADDLYEIPDGKPSLPIPTPVPTPVNVTVNNVHTHVDTHKKQRRPSLPIHNNANWAKLSAQLEKQFEQNSPLKSTGTTLRPATATPTPTGAAKLNKPKPPTKPKPNPKKLTHSVSVPVPDSRPQLAMTLTHAHATVTPQRAPPSPSPSSISSSAAGVPTPFTYCPPTPTPPPPQPTTPTQHVEHHNHNHNNHIEQVLLPTRATKEEDSRNFIESLKRKLSQKNHLVASLISSVASSATISNYSSHNNKEDNHNHNHLMSKSGKGNKKGNQQNQSKNNATTTTNDANAHATLSRSNNYNNTSNNDAQQCTPTAKAMDPDSIRKVCDSVQKFPWFYRVDRSKAELILENYNLDGSFLVRECQHGGPNVPFTLTIRFGQRCFHIQIRLRVEDSNFALGTEKVNEKHFETVQELIDTYRKTPLQLHTNGKFFGETKLSHPPIVYSFSK